MMTIDMVCGMVGGIEPHELEHWIHQRWVLPDSGDSGYLFHDFDVARVRLIVELKHDLAIDEEAMPVLRRRMKALAAAIEALPEESRQALRARLNDERGE